MDKVKVDGVWKETETIYVKVDNAWKEAEQVYVNSGGSWLEAEWSNLPDFGATLSHTAKGQFTITNYDDRYTYWVVLGNDPAGPSGGTVDENGVITTNTATSEYTVFLGKKVGETDRNKTLETVFYRQARTYYNYGCTDQRYNPCGDCTDAPGYWDWSCGCYGGNAGGGQWGKCICRKAATCTGENEYSGYTKRHDEWVKIGEPEAKDPVARSVSVAPNVIPLAAFDGDAPFIHSFPLGKEEDYPLDGEMVTKFADAFIEVYDNSGELIDTIVTQDGELIIEIADYDNSCRATLISHDMQKGSGTFTLTVLDSLGELVHTENGEWYNG